MVLLYATILCGVERDECLRFQHIQEFVAVSLLVIDRELELS